MALGESSNGGMHSLLFGLLVLAMLLLLLGATLAVVALYYQRKDRQNVAALEPMENDIR